MKCSECQEELIGYLEGLLERERQAEVDQHLRECSVCRAEADAHAHLRDRLIDDGKGLAQVQLASQVMARIAQEQASWRRRLAMVMRSPKTRIGLAAAAALIVALFVILPGPQMSSLSAEEVLDRTAKALRSVKAYHYEMRTPGVPSALVREIWAQGDRIYARGLREGELVAEFWADSTRIVRYDRQTNKVTISDVHPGLLRAMAGIEQICNFKPEDWRAFPEDRIKQDGRWYRVFELPGTGTFRGMGRSGEYKLRLSVDEETYLPARLEGQLKPTETTEWEPFMEIDFLWDEEQVPEDLFEPSYPDTAPVDDQRQLPEPEAGQEAPPAPSEEVTKPIVALKDGVALEKLWIHPTGLLLMRMALGSRQPFGMPPELEDPEKNPWGLKGEEIPLALKGQVIFEGPVAVRRLGAGGMPKRWAGYLVYEFEPKADETVPATLTFRYLLARRRLPSETGRWAYGNAVLKDPSAWHLYQFTVPTKDYVVNRIPEEIYASPNLHAEKILFPALKKIVERYQAQGQPEKALAFMEVQGPNTRRLLEKLLETE